MTPLTGAVVGFVVGSSVASVGVLLVQGGAISEVRSRAFMAGIMHERTRIQREELGEVDLETLGVGVEARRS